MRGSHESVAFPGNRFDQAGITKGFSQCVYVVSKVVFFNNRVRPDCRDEVVFFDQATRPGHKHTESIEHLSAQRDRTSVAQKPPLPGLETEWSELVHPFQSGTRLPLKHRAYDKEKLQEKSRTR